MYIRSMTVSSGASPMAYVLWIIEGVHLAHAQDSFCLSLTPKPFQEQIG
jgi:hypothetical protein